MRLTSKTCGGTVPSEPIGFAVVGLGVGAAHAREISLVPGARLVGVYDRDAQRLASVATRHGCKQFGAYEQLLDDPAVDVVSIATPNGTHSRLGVMAAEAGKHLVVEKPLDVSLAAADRLIEASERAGVKLAGIFQSRFCPLFCAIKEAVNIGRLGPLYGVHADMFWWRDESYFAAAGDRRRADWRMDGGGALATQGVHTLDLVQWFGGPVASVFGYMGRYVQDIEAEDKLSCLLRFQSGAIGSLNATTVAWGGGGDTLTVHGQGGTIATGKQRETLEVWQLRNDNADESRRMLARFGPGGDRDWADDPHTGHRDIFSDMVRAIVEDRKPAVDGREARVAVELMLAIYESCRSGLEVRLPLAAQPD